MKIKSLKTHLRPYSILGRRKTTINHAFASALAPSDVFDEETAKAAVYALGQNPEEELQCVYCDALAETWDHVLATVEKGEFSGAGHVLANLVPCCKTCNSSKGSKHWGKFILGRNEAITKKEERIRLIENHLNNLSRIEAPQNDRDYVEYSEIRSQVLDLLIKADVLANKLRLKASGNSKNSAE